MLWIYPRRAPMSAFQELKWAPTDTNCPSMTTTGSNPLPYSSILALALLLNSNQYFKFINTLICTERQTNQKWIVLSTSCWNAHTLKELWRIPKASLLIQKQSWVIWNSKFRAKFGGGELWKFQYYWATWCAVAWQKTAICMQVTVMPFLGLALSWS